MEEDDGLNAVRGCFNAFLIMLLVFMVIGTIMGVKD